MRRSFTLVALLVSNVLDVVVSTSYLYPHDCMNAMPDLSLAFASDRPGYMEAQLTVPVPCRGTEFGHAIIEISETTIAGGTIVKQFGIHSPVSNDTYGKTYLTIPVQPRAQYNASVQVVGKPAPKIYSSIALASITIPDFDVGALLPAVQEVTLNNRTLSWKTPALPPQSPNQSYAGFKIFLSDKSWNTSMVTAVNSSTVYNFTLPSFPGNRTYPQVGGLQFFVVMQNATSMGTISSFQSVVQLTVVYKNNETYYRDPATNITTKDLIVLAPRDVYYNNAYELLTQSTMVKELLANTFDVEDAPQGSRTAGSMRFWGRRAANEQCPTCTIISTFFQKPTSSNFFVTVFTTLTLLIDICDSGLPQRPYIATCVTATVDLNPIPCVCAGGVEIKSTQFFSSYCKGTTLSDVLPGLMGVCTECSTTCPVAGSYMSKPCRQIALGNIMCSYCPLINCNATQYGVPCNETRIGYCADCTNCTGTTYMTAPCNTRADTQCASCLSYCSAMGTDSCSSATQCTCKPGFVGPKCDQCQAGLFAQACDQSCRCNAAGSTDSSCRANDGTCTCKDGFTGWACDRCIPGRYGIDCASTCACSVNGTCLDGLTGDGSCFCKAGYTGQYCNETVIIHVEQPLDNTTKLNVHLIGGQMLGAIAAREDAALYFPIPTSLYRLLDPSQDPSVLITMLQGPSWLAVRSAPATGSGYTLSGTPRRSDLTATNSSFAILRVYHMNSTESIDVQVGIAVALSPKPPQFTAMSGLSAAVETPWELLLRSGVEITDADSGFGDVMTLAAYELQDWMQATLSMLPLAVLRIAGTPPLQSANTIASFFVIAADSYGLAVNQTFNLHLLPNDDTVHFTSVPVVHVEQDKPFALQCPPATVAPPLTIHAYEIHVVPSAECSWIQVMQTSSRDVPVLHGVPNQRDVDAASECTARLFAFVNGHGNTSTTVSIYLVNTNDAPTALRDTITLQASAGEHVRYALNVASLFADADTSYGDYLTYSVGNYDAGIAQPSLQCARGDCVLHMVAPLELGSITLSIIATDSHGLYATVRVICDIGKHQAFHLISSSWGECSASCGKGMSYSLDYCVNSEFQPVDAQNCLNGSTAATQQCEGASPNCSGPRYVTGLWSSCSSTCSVPDQPYPTSHRDVRCLDAQSVVLDDLDCPGEKPDTIRECHTHTCSSAPIAPAPEATACTGLMDAYGNCCDFVDASGQCCASGDIDECGVCDGVNDCRMNVEVVALGTCDAALTQSITLKQDLATSMNLPTKAVDSVQVACWDDAPGTQSVTFYVQLGRRALLSSADLSAYLNDRLTGTFLQLTSLEQLSFKRTPACGNGVCEIGERCRGPRCDPNNICPQDCPIPVLSCPASQSNQRCGHGACHLPTGKCICAEGYTGPACEYCGTNYTYIEQDGNMHCDHIAPSHDNPVQVDTSTTDLHFNPVYRYNVRSGETVDIETPAPALDAAATISTFAAIPAQQNCSWVTVVQDYPDVPPRITGIPSDKHVGFTCKIDLHVTTTVAHTAEAVVLIVVGPTYVVPQQKTTGATPQATPAQTVLIDPKPTLDAATLIDSRLSNAQPDTLLPYVTSGAAVGAATLSGVIVYFLVRRRKSHDVPEPTTPSETSKPEEYIIKQATNGLRSSDDQRLSRAERGSRVSRNAQLEDDEPQIVPAPRFSTAPTGVASSNKADNLLDFGERSPSTRGASRTNVMQLVRGVGLRSQPTDARKAGPPGSTATNTPLLFVSNPMNGAMSAGNSPLISKNNIMSPKR